MTNKEKIRIIDQMEKNYEATPEEFPGLCALFRSVETDGHGLCWTFSIITMIAWLYGGSMYCAYWWQAGDFTQRLKVLKALKRWYKFKHILLP